MDRGNNDRGDYDGRGRGRGGGRGVDFSGRGTGGDSFRRGRGGGRGGDFSGRGRGGYGGGRGRGYQHPPRHHQYGGGRGRGYQHPPQHHPYGGGRVSEGGDDGSHPRNRSAEDRMVSVGTSAGNVAPQTLTQILTQMLGSISVQEVPKARQPSKGSVENAFNPVRRPDRGGTLALRTVKLLVNHFPVSFNPSNTLLHYDVEVKREGSCDNQSVKRSITKDDLRLIREKLCSERPDLFPLLKTAYDGEKNIFSAVRLPVGTYKVQLSDGGVTNGRTYEFTIKFVNEVRLSMLKDYLSGKFLQIPRVVLQGMDLVMKENLYSHKISIGKGGRGFYPRVFEKGDDLYCGVAAFKGFQQSLKPTSNGLAMCLDYSVLAFRKRMPVIDFLKERIPSFQGVGDVRRLQREVTDELKGLKVTVTHRRTKQKYTIAGLSDEITRNILFEQEDPKGKEEPKTVMLLAYFQEKWGKEIQYKDIPCLQLGRGKKPNSVPMEFCVLVEGQRCSKEELSKEANKKLRGLSLIPARQRRTEIQRMVQEEYGPHASRDRVIQNFEFGIGMSMTEVSGRVMPPPNLKVGSSNGRMQSMEVDKLKCQWNLLGGKTVVEGKAAECWALIDFSAGKCNTDYFIDKLMNRCRSLGVGMEDPLVVRLSNMRELSSVDGLFRLLSNIVEEADRRCKGKLQIIICVMASRDEGYKSLKWVSETRIGVVTQCCLSTEINKANDQYFANLGLKINAKLGGSNVELVKRFSCFSDEDHVMFIGADVNHPAASNKTSPSIAAVVASVNWPAATRYAARVSPQFHRQEEIENLGKMCLDLIKTYEQVNRRKPNKIIVFRDGVSDGQFYMVLNNELVDLKLAIYDEDYKPSITLVVAQKRHTTRLFPKTERDGVHPGNIPPGTVVDEGIIHPLEFDFYLNSHFGGLGTSKPTHYSVLWDENGFSSDTMQELIYYLCYTYARCTKPVSLVTPVYYADLVAYRGRMFQEVAAQLPALAASGGWYNNQAFYNLEPGLKDCMFFV
ncbi:protein argonaute 2-like [Cynara cardunculus var. scolymus]|uniref:protein argonaute 2-like n=1 Tax=Cynara cardunculus var. scolymus TaxID=59895 RepID=UPI000D629CC6|nr:protein argonaute 2-like [Cynara cardunculus var. scolymus]